MQCYKDEWENCGLTSRVERDGRGKWTERVLFYLCRSEPPHSAFVT